MTPARLADGAIHMFESAVCVASLAAIVVLVLVQVFYRYVLSSGILWLNEVVINLMILLVLVGAALATRHAGGPFTFGDTPGLADICLVPQMGSADRFGVDTSAMPRLREITANCLALPAFADAAPGRQPDADA